jgi:uncharacterized protein YidB (DUF937 family)
MGFLDDMLGKAAQGGGGPNSALIDGVLGMLAGGGQAGGLAGLIQAFQGKGLGEIISSWVGTGQNLPISADQLRHGLGSDVISQLAAKVGLAPDAATSQLAGLLPKLIDQLTPDGKVPEGGLLQQGLDLLRKNLPQG